MSFSIIANIRTKEEVELTSVTPTPLFMEAIANNYGGTAEDYTYYTITEEEITRLNNEDEYTLVWDGEILKGIDFTIEDKKGWLKSEISVATRKITLNAIDVQKVKVFSKDTVYAQNDLVFKEDNVWKCQEAIASKDPGANSTWSEEAPAVLLTFTILLADKSTVDTTANFNSKILVGMSNETTADMEVAFSNGICKKVIVLNNIGNCGEWTFPTPMNHIILNDTPYRVDSTAKFSGMLPY